MLIDAREQTNSTAGKAIRNRSRRLVGVVSQLLVCLRAENKIVEQRQIKEKVKVRVKAKVKAKAKVGEEDTQTRPQQPRSSNKLLSEHNILELIRSTETGRRSHKSN